MEGIMFDLIVNGDKRRPFHDGTIAPVVASVGLHTALLTAVVILPLLYVTNTLPEMPTMLAFVAEPPAPPPPPPPPPAPRTQPKPGSDQARAIPDASRNAAP